LLNRRLHRRLQLALLGARDVRGPRGDGRGRRGAGGLLRLLDVLGLLIELAHGAHLIGDVEPGGAEPERAAEGFQRALGKFLLEPGADLPRDVADSSTERTEAVPDRRGAGDARPWRELRAAHELRARRERGEVRQAADLR